MGKVMRYSQAEKMEIIRMVGHLILR